MPFVTVIPFITVYGRLSYYVTLDSLPIIQGSAGIVCTCYCPINIPSLWSAGAGVIGLRRYLPNIGLGRLVVEITSPISSFYDGGSAGVGSYLYHYLSIHIFMWDAAKFTYSSKLFKFKNSKLFETKLYLFGQIQKKTNQNSFEFLK